MRGRRGVALLLALAACYPTEPLPRAPEQLVVHAVLDLGTHRQLIELGRNSSEWSRRAFGVPDASVVVTGPDGTPMTAWYDSATSALKDESAYWLIPGEYARTLQPGATYTLRITLADGSVATSQTTVPAATPVAPTGVVPFDRNADTLRLSWPRVPGAAAYFVSVVGRISLGYDATGQRYSAFADTLLTLAGTARTMDDDPVFLSRDSVTVLVVAVDENFEVYYRPFVDPFAGAPPSRIAGALGVFGSVVPIVARRYAVR